MRTYTPFAKVEPMFFLADPRFRSLPTTGKVLYLALWFRAVAERRETMSEQYGVKEAARDAGIDERSCAKMLRQLQQKCLISTDRKKRITVCGVKSKHEGMDWRDGANPSLEIAPSGGKRLSEQSKRRIKDNALTTKQEREINNIPEVGRSVEPMRLPGVAMIGAMLVGKMTAKVVRNDPERVKAMNNLLTAVDERMEVEGVEAFRKCVDERMSAETIRRLHETVCRNSVDMALMVWLAGRASKPPAKMTSLLRHGLPERIPDDAWRWKERVVKVQKARTG
jgi:hypothetical protein